ncbi:MAG: hypothetical protein HPY83_13815 [Anaerolineae bacterium]|nr:hypothetical protein [Anaerolineae bacterium]
MPPPESPSGPWGRWEVRGECWDLADLAAFAAVRDLLDRAELIPDVVAIGVSSEGRKLIVRAWSASLSAEIRRALDEVQAAHPDVVFLGLRATWEPGAGPAEEEGTALFLRPRQCDRSRSTAESARPHDQGGEP